MKLKFFLLLLLSLSIEAQATIRYVSKTGTSTPPYTSWQTAADSIQKCINICVDGDTIYVANGIYKENLIINTAISLIGSSMDSTVIDGRGMADYSINIKKNATIENFSLYGKVYNAGICVYSVSSNFPVITVRNCNISEAAGGIASYGLIAENVILKNLRGGINPAGLPNSNNFISNCVIVVQGNYATGISLAGPTYANYEINNNIILFSGTANPSNGISIGAPRRVTIKNNLISGFGAANVFIDDPADTTFIINNVLAYQYMAGSSASILTGGDWVKAKNLILIKNKTGIIGDLAVYSNFNLYWRNITANLYGVTPGDNDIVADPMFLNDTIPTANGGYDFHLQKYSPAIDKGDPAILDVDGSRSDIGMFGGPYGESYTYQDLAPKPPANLTTSMDSGLVHLKWNKNTEADLFRYRVYRDTVPDFIYDTTKIIAVISDTTFYDDPPQKFISGNYYYKITAIDSAYHQSPASEEKHINITGIPEAPPIVVEHYRLLNNYPNPFNPSTTIPYRLKAPGYVKVMVYNLLGELVRVLVNQFQSAGYYEVLFHPTATERKSAEGKIEFETGYGDIVSGIYLYRIEVIGEGNIPVFTDMKKMMLVK
jgi:hypothetical protein